MPNDSDDASEMVGENADPGHRMFEMTCDDFTKEEELDEPIGFRICLAADLDAALAAVLDAKAKGEDPRIALKAALRARRC